jgi:hypothetical protein
VCWLLAPRRPGSRCTRPRPPRNGGVARLERCRWLWAGRPVRPGASS